MWPSAADLFAAWRNSQIKKASIKATVQNWRPWIYLKLNVPLNLHRTSTTAAIDVSSPRLLVATHRYAPLSTRLALVIANCFLSSEKLNLGFLLMSDPSLVHDRVGGGYPVALQRNVTFSPSVFVTLLGWVVISLLSTIVKQLHWTLEILAIGPNIFLNSTINGR